MNAFRSLTRWQAVTMIVVLVAAFGGTLGGYYLLASDSDQAELGENQLLIPVRLGDLVNEVSISGSLVYSNREALSFGADGVVAEVLVDEGDAVQDGQPLARLDDESVAALERAAAKARIGLRDAEDALDETLAPHSTLDAAKAEAAVADARVALQKAEEDLNALAEPTAYDIAKAKAAVADASVALDNAVDDVNALTGLAAYDLAKAVAAVSSGRVSLAAAEEALAELLAGADGDAIAAANSAIRSAGTAMDNAEIDLELTMVEWNDKLDAARTTTDEALEDLRGVYSKWFGVELDSEELTSGIYALLKSWNTNLESLFDPDSPWLRDYAFIDGSSADADETPWNELTLISWLKLYPGKVVATCESPPKDDAQCVQMQLEEAWDSYTAHRDELETVKAQSNKASFSAHEAVTASEEKLAEAKDALTDLQTPADEIDVQHRRDEADLAAAALDRAMEDLDELTAEPDFVQLEAARTQVVLQRAMLEQTKEDLDELTAEPDFVQLEAARTQVVLQRAMLEQTKDDLEELAAAPDAVELESARMRVSLKEATLEQAVEDLAAMEENPDALDVALREAEIVAASAALNEAAQKLDDVILRAPWDGIVTSLDVEAEQEVKAGETVMRMVDPSVVEMDGIVDEIDVLFLQKGATASITMDALPGQALVGAVTSIATEPNTQQGVVSYPLRIEVQATEGLQLPEGLTAVASVVIREDRDALLIPLQSLYGSFDQPAVRVMTDDGAIEERPVSLGNSDDFWAVVQDGLSEGDVLVMESQDAGSTQFGFGRGFVGPQTFVAPAGGGRRP